jgi:hypothetical protein
MLLVGAVLLIADVTDFERGALGRLLCAPAEGLLHLGILVMPHEFLVQLDLLVGVGVVRNLDLNVALAVARERTADIAQNRASVKGHFLRSSFYHHTHLLVLLLVDIVNSTLLAILDAEREDSGACLDAMKNQEMKKRQFARENCLFLIFSLIFLNSSFGHICRIAGI